MQSLISISWSSLLQILPHTVCFWVPVTFHHITLPCFCRVLFNIWNCLHHLFFYYPHATVRMQASDGRNPACLVSRSTGWDSSACYRSGTQWWLGSLIQAAKWSVQWSYYSSSCGDYTSHVEYHCQVCVRGHTYVLKRASDAVQVCHFSASFFK